MGITSIGQPGNVHGAIALASSRTGIDFDYLLGQAQVESGMRPDARASTSSATGLFQFIDQSWMEVLKKHGGEHGYGWAADSIQQSGGRYYISDPATRRAVMDLRNDPQAASLMAAEHASDNKTMLEGVLDRPVTGTDLYMAHFLGPGGARNFLTAMADNPNRTGASMFPAAARANRSIFYEPSGQPRTLAAIYHNFSTKLDRGAAAVGATGLASSTLGGPAPAAGGQPAWDPALLAGNEVILGNGAVGGDRHWVETTLAQLKVSDGGASPASGLAGLGGDPLTLPGMMPGIENLDGLAATNGFGGVNGLSSLPGSPLRPTPETAKLAYLMLASLGA